MKSQIYWNEGRVSGKHTTRAAQPKVYGTIAPAAPVLPQKTEPTLQQATTQVSEAIQTTTPTPAYRSSGKYPTRAKNLPPIYLPVSKSGSQFSRSVGIAFNRSQASKYASRAKGNPFGYITDPFYITRAAFYNTKTRR